MKITEAGNVGIGTTNPSAKLAVSSSDMLTSGWNVGNSSQYHWFGPSSASTAESISTYIGIEATGANISGATASGAYSEVLHSGANTLGVAQGLVGKVRNASTGTIGTANG
jgi:hypothetical protein